MRKAIVLSGFMAAALGMAFTVQAEDRSGFYVGASIGEATNEVDEFKGSDTAFKLTGGYAFNKYFGIELAYVDSGTQTDTIEGIDLTTSSDGVIASAVLSLPIGEKFALFGKLGYAVYDVEATARLGNLSERDSGSDEDFAYGVGLEFAVGRGLHLRAEYEVVDVTDGDFDMVSAGVAYKF